MSPLRLVASLLSVATVLWLGRRVPLVGWRKHFVIGCRLAAVGAVCMALWGPPFRRTRALPARVMYLVDGSASIDAAQRSWIARRIASLESMRPVQIERAVIAFGHDAQMIHPFSSTPLTNPDELERTLADVPLARDQTNLEAALLSALGASALAQRGSLILLSDGRETSGDAGGIVSALRGIGLRVFPATPPVGEHATSVWESLSAPPVVQRGSPVAMQLVIFNGASGAKRGEVTVALQGVSVKRQRVTVRPGWQVLGVSVPAIGRGTMTLDVRLAIPEDNLAESRRVYTEVAGPPQILFVSDHTAALPALATALKRREMDIAVARQVDLPSDAARLLDYDAVLLFNIPKSSLTTAQASALQTYVETAGGGLLTVGLGGDLAQEITTLSPIDALLPVHFEPKGLQEAKRRVCMVLLIDRSASMLGPRIAATKRAAVELVKQLSPEDLVGVLAFDTQPYVIAEIQSAGQVSARLVEKLVKLRSSGGTDVYPALTAASDRLELTGATLKHIILLSDGNTPFAEEAYRALVKSFRQHGTTVSTIGIGSAFINTDYLRWLAQSTGGTFYQLRQLEELPALIARDTQRELGRLPFAEGYFQPSRAPTSDWFAETTGWPSLRGYLTTTAKPGARVDLTVNGGEGDDPLLARWSVGLGRVASFLSDAQPRWCPEWIRWPAFESTWAQVIRWVMRPRLMEEVFVWVDDHEQPAQVVLEGNLRNPRAELITPDGTHRLPLSLVQTGPWRWHASLEQVASGWYQLALESFNLITSQGSASAAGGSEARDVPQFAKRWIQIGSPPSAQELSGQPPNQALLRRIAGVTSGTYNMPDRAFVPPTTPVTTTEPPLGWWLPLAILTLLIDIALRGSSML